MNDSLKFKYVGNKHGLMVGKVFTLAEIEDGQVSIWTRDLNINRDLFRLRFTGKQDKNGTDIYEGDITSNGIVMWNNNLHWDGGGSIHSGFYLIPSFQIDSFHQNGIIALDYHKAFDEDIELLGYNYYIHNEKVWENLC